MKHNETTCSDCGGGGILADFDAIETCFTCGGHGVVTLPECRDDCLNPVDCGANGLPNSLCRACGDAYRADMEDRDRGLGHAPRWYTDLVWMREKPCSSCIHVRLDPTDHTASRCAAAFPVVTAYSLRALIGNARAENGLCGPQARHFEPKALDKGEKQR